MTYPYLIKRIIPFSLGFLSAVFVTSLFQAFGSIGQSAHVPEVADMAYSGKTFSCKYKMRGHGSGSGTGYGIEKPSYTDGALRILHKPSPEYTADARRNRTEGIVRLRVTFLASGAIGSIIPLNKLGDGLTEQAVTAAQKIEFEPARRDGTPISITKEIEYRFSFY